MYKNGVSYKIIDVLIAGIENGENFQHAEQSLHLFSTDKVLFVSRYPQSRDLRDWLQSNTNQYLHFGDFDLAGIHIFLNEIYSSLGKRATFFVPDNIDDLLARGNAKLYDKQYQKYKNLNISDTRLKTLVEKIHFHRKTYEQEGLLAEQI